MDSNYHRTLSQQAGFTLVELMVGLAIGMFVSMVIMQVLSFYEAQKRVTTGTADAQTNGGIALFNIGRELQVAGYPLMPSTTSALKCTTLSFGATGITDIFPVILTDGEAASGVAGASDTISIRYGNSSMGGVPTVITAMVGLEATVANNFGCNVGDITLITNGSTCALSSATAVTAPTVVPATITLQNISAAIPGANIACLGTWNEVVYRVNNGNLERNGVPSVAGIVNIQAQYGISTAANSNQVTQWVDASGGTWAAPSIANRNRIKAIRIAVVARNAKMEPAAVTTACSSTTAASPTGLCAWAGSTSSPAPIIDLSSLDPDWLRYRYRVFENIIPLRNMIWSKDTFMRAPARFHFEQLHTAIKQRAVVLFFALIALLAMSLAAVALIRSVDTSTLIAGNLAFKQSATSAGDTGVEAAIAWLAATEAANNALNVVTDGTHPFNVTNLAVTPGYHSSLNTALNLTDATTWDGINNVVVGTDASGNTTSYIIQRMCRNANQPIQFANCLFSAATQDKNGQNIPLPQDICQGDGCPTAGQSPLIRITVRTTGPRFTVSYIQAYVY